MCHKAFSRLALALSDDHPLSRDPTALLSVASASECISRRATASHARSPSSALGRPFLRSLAGEGERGQAVLVDAFGRRRPKGRAGVVASASWPGPALGRFGGFRPAREHEAPPGWALDSFSAQARRLTSLSQPHPSQLTSPYNTMAAPRSIARKALASASAARSFSTVLNAARPAAVAGLRSSVKAPVLTVRPSLPSPQSLAARARSLACFGKAATRARACSSCRCFVCLLNRALTRPSHLALFRFPPPHLRASPFLARGDRFPPTPVSLPSPPLLRSIATQRGIKTIDFAGTEEVVYERADWPLPKLQECVPMAFLAPAPNDERSVFFCG